MLKRSVFNAAVLGTVFSIFAIQPAMAASSTSPRNPARLFDLSGLDDLHRNLVKEVLGRFDYDWSQLRAALEESAGRTRIPIGITDLSEWNAVGLSWPHGLIEIDDDVRRHGWFKEVVMHEIGHIVEFFHLTPEALHDEVAGIYGAPWSAMGHNFNNGFIAVFSSYRLEDSSYPLTRAQRRALRALLGGSGEMPEKTW